MRCLFCKVRCRQTPRVGGKQGDREREGGRAGGRDREQMGGREGGMDRGREGGIEGGREG